MDQATGTNYAAKGYSSMADYVRNTNVAATPGAKAPTATPEIVNSQFSQPGATNTLLSTNGQQSGVLPNQPTQPPAAIPMTGMTPATPLQVPVKQNNATGATAALGGGAAATFAQQPAYDATTGLLTDYGKSQGLPEVNDANNGGSNGGTTDTSASSDTSSTGGLSAGLTKIASYLGIDIPTLFSKLANKGTETQNIEDQEGIDTKTQQATDAANAYTAAKTALDQQVTALYGRPGVSREQSDADAAEVNRIGNANLANLAIVSNAASNNLTAAQSLVTQKVNNEFQPLQDDLTYLQDFYTMNQNDLSDSEKLALTNKYNTDNQNAQDLKTAYTTTLTNATNNLTAALKNGSIDAGTMSNALAAIDTAWRAPGATAATIAAAAGAYGADASVALDNEYKQAQIAKTYSDIKAAQTSGSPTVALVNDAGNTVSVPTDVAPYYNVASNGVEYVDASTLQGTATEKTKIINDAQAAGYQIITNKNEAADLTNIKDANSNLNTISTIVAGIGQPNWLSRTLGGLGLTSLETMTQSDPQKAAAGALQSVGLDILKAISGIQGFRGNATAIQQVTDHLPKITDTVDTINQKVAYIQQLINNRENAIVGTPQNTQDQIVNGVTYTLGSDGLYHPK